MSSLDGSRRVRHHSFYRLTGLNRPICIWGLGSPHGDDRVGWEVVRQLRADLPSCEIVSAVASPWDILPNLKSGCRVIVVDACQTGGLPGTILRFGREESLRFSSPVRSSHAGSLAELLQLAEALEISIQEWVLLAVELEKTTPGADLSDAVLKAANDVCDQIQAIVRRWERADA